MQTQLNELKELVAIACSNTSNRAAAEEKLLEIQRSPNTWKFYLQLLNVADDSMLFFIGQGLKYAVVKFWVTEIQQNFNFFVEQLLNCLYQRKNIQQFSRNKLEQIVSQLCIQQENLQLISVFLSTCLHNGNISGNTSTIDLSSLQNLQPLDWKICLSLVKTVIEDIGLTDTKKNYLSSIKKDHITRDLSNRVSYFTEFACLGCKLFADTLYGTAPAATHEIRMIAHQLLIECLALMRVIIGSVPVGAHLSRDVFSLLLGIVDVGAGEGQISDDERKNRLFVSSAAMEVLNELMWSRYLPTVTDRTQVVDTGVVVLMEILMQLMEVLKKYRGYAMQNKMKLDDISVVSKIVSGLFACFKVHGSRFTSFVYKQNSNSTADSTRVKASILFYSICEEVCTVLQLSSTIELCTECISLVGLLIGDLKETMFRVCIGSDWTPDMRVRHKSILTALLKYLLCYSNTEFNPELTEYLEDLQDDIVLLPFMDEDVKKAVIRVSTVDIDSECKPSDDDDRGNEVLQLFDAVRVGIPVILSHIDMLTDVVVSNEVVPISGITGLSNILREIVNMDVYTVITSLFSRCIQSYAVNRGSEKGIGALLDATFLLSLLPLSMTNTNSRDACYEYLKQLLGLLDDESIITGGKFHCYFYVSACQVCCRLLNEQILAIKYATKFSISSQAGIGSVSVLSLPQLFELYWLLFMHIMKLVEISIMRPISMNHMLAGCSFLLAVFIDLDNSAFLGEFIKYVDLRNGVESTDRNHSYCLAVLTSLLGKLAASTSIEVYSILCCVSFLISPDVLINIQNIMEHECGNIYKLLQSTDLSANIEILILENSSMISTVIRQLAVSEVLITLLQSVHSRTRPAVSSFYSNMLTILVQLLIKVIESEASKLLSGSPQTPSPKRTNGHMHIGLLLQLLVQLMKISSVLLGYYGKRQFGSCCGNLYISCCQFLTVTNPVLGDITPVEVLLQAAVSAGSKGSLLRNRCFSVIKETLALGQSIGKSAGSAAPRGLAGLGIPATMEGVPADFPRPEPTSAEHIAATYGVLKRLSVLMSENWIRTEILHELLQMGWRLVKVYWDGSDRMLIQQLGPQDGVSVNSGLNVRHVVVFLVKLLVQCFLTDSVSPQEILLCAESLTHMGCERNLFGTSWFNYGCIDNDLPGDSGQESVSNGAATFNCRSSILACCIRAIISNLHAIHHDSIIEIMQIMVNRTTETQIEYLQYFNGLVREIATELRVLSQVEQYIANYSTKLQSSLISTSAGSSKFDVKLYVNEVLYGITFMIVSGDN